MAASSSSSSWNSDQLNVIPSTPPTSTTTYEVGEKWTPDKPVPDNMRICEVDGCVVYKEYVDLSVKEIMLFNEHNGEDARRPFAYAAVECHGMLVIADAGVLSECPVFKVLIDVHDTLNDTSFDEPQVQAPIVVNDPSLQVRIFIISIFKCVWLHTWKHTMRGVISRDPGHFCKWYNICVDTLYASQCGLDYLEI